jgi:hypothetical protein
LGRQIVVKPTETPIADEKRVERNLT